MRSILTTLLLGLTLYGAKAEDLYEFVSDCRAATLARCFGRIEGELDHIRAAEQGAGFCLPRAWPGMAVESTSYPVSFLDYVLLRLSAARVGKAGQPVGLVLRDMLADLYPCWKAAP